MTARFERSFPIIGRLAQDVHQTPPSKNDPEYVDRALMIVGQTLQAQDSKIEQGFLRQQQFIASEFREADKRTDEKLREAEKKTDEKFKRFEERFEERFQRIDERFRQVDEQFRQVDQRFQQVDQRFERLEKKVDDHFHILSEEIRNLKVQMENSAAIARNGRLRRMHQPINLVKALKTIPNTNNVMWTTPRSMPKHTKGIYMMGQHAQGIFEGIWEDKTTKEKSEAKRKALEAIKELARFYEVTVLSDEMSETDATEAILDDYTVDQYMELLLDEWGMDWQKVCRLGKQHMQSTTQQVTGKRTGDTNIGGEKPMKQQRE